MKAFVIPPSLSQTPYETDIESASTSTFEQLFGTTSQGLDYLCVGPGKTMFIPEDPYGELPVNQNVAKAKWKGQPYIVHGGAVIVFESKKIPKTFNYERVLTNDLKKRHSFIESMEQDPNVRVIRVRDEEDEPVPNPIIKKMPHRMSRVEEQLEKHSLFKEACEKSQGLRFAYYTGHKAGFSWQTAKNNKWVRGMWYWCYDRENPKAPKTNPFN